MTELNGNEKYARLSVSLPIRPAAPSGIRTGDLMMYGASTVVVFYKAFPTAYSYTSIERIQDPDGLEAAHLAPEMSTSRSNGAAKDRGERAGARRRHTER